MIIGASSAAVFFVVLIILVAFMLLKRRNRQRKGKYVRFVLLFSYLTFVAMIRLFRYHYFMEAIYWPSLISTSEIHWVCEKKTEDKSHHIAESEQGFFQKKNIYFLGFQIILIADWILGLYMRSCFVSINGRYHYSSNLTYLYTLGMEIMIFSLFLKFINHN